MVTEQLGDALALGSHGLGDSSDHRGPLPNDLGIRA